MTTVSPKTETKSRTFSIRLTDAEHKRIREISKRLNASESAVIRFAIRSMLNRTGPLSDPSSSAFSLIPVFVEYGEEIINYFDLDAIHLDRIINGKTADESSKVEIADLKLLSASSLGKPHVHAKLKELNASRLAHDDVQTMLRGYFYEKYIYDDQTPGERQFESSED